MIEHLPVLTPDPARSARTLEQCRQRLEPRRSRLVLEQAVFAGLCAVYLASVALNVARILIR